MTPKDNRIAELEAQVKEAYGKEHALNQINALNHLKRELRKAKPQLDKLSKKIDVQKTIPLFDLKFLDVKKATHELFKTILEECDATIHGG